MRDWIEAAGVEQGLLDHAFAERGCDDLDRRSSLPARVTVKVAEGFAYYALDPELYARAARGLPARSTVVGVRSIGTALAPVVARAIGAERVFTVRPVGPPFERRLALSGRLADSILCGEHFVIVDEGPGMSGSSFGSVLSFLLGHGVGLDRITLLPSHENDPGPAASPWLRALWPRLDRRVAPYSVIEAQLPGWFSDVCGEAIALEDLGAGRWREGETPAVVPAWERRKYRLTTPRGRFFLEWVGLGRQGREALSLATRLAGFSAPPLALRRGYLASPWIEGGPRAPDAAALAAYLRARAALPCEGLGASPALLAEMIRVNLGVEVEPPPERPRVCIDGRLHAHEWLGGYKTDALTHHARHDLIGDQPLAWDVAGAIVELGLEPLPAPDLDFYVLAYRAFQHGSYTLGAQLTEDGPERARLLERAARYA